MNTQPDLPLRPLRPLQPRPDVTEFTQLLHRAVSWLSSREILSELDLLDTENHRRWLRHLAECSEGEVISGRDGYCHVARARPEEIDHFANWMVSQGKCMIKRGIRTRKRAHQLVG